MAASALLQRKRDDAYLGTCVDEVSDLGDAVGDAVGNAVGDVEKTPGCEADDTDRLQRVARPFPAKAQGWRHW